MKKLSCLSITICALLLSFSLLAGGCRSNGAVYNIRDNTDPVNVFVFGGHTQQMAGKTVPFDILRSPTLATGGSGSTVTAEPAPSSPVEPPAELSMSAPYLLFAPGLWPPDDLELFSCYQFPHRRYTSETTENESYPDLPQWPFICHLKTNEGQVNPGRFVPPGS